MDQYVGLRQFQNANPGLIWEQKTDMADVSLSMVMDILAGMSDYMFLLIF